MAYESNRSEGRGGSGRSSRPSSGRPSSGRSSSPRSSSRSSDARSSGSRSTGGRSDAPHSSGRDSGTRGEGRSESRPNSRPSSSRGSSPRSDSPRGSAPRGAGRPPRRDDEFRAPRSNDSRSRSSSRSDDRDDRRSAPRRDDARSTSRPRRDNAPREERRFDSRSDSRPRSSSRGADRDDRRSAPRRDDAPRGERRSDGPRSDRRSAPRREDSRRDDSRAPRGDRRQDGRSDARAPREGGRTRPVGKPDERGGRERRDDRFDSTEFVAVDKDIDIKILPRQVVAELRNISPAAADFVSKHLAAAMYALEDDDAERAYQHAIAARSRAARLGCVREMVGTSAYYAGKWAEALSEFRTFQRLTGDPGFLPLMADCERGLGRPLRALQIARSSQVNSLDAATRIELRIVASGARRDLGQFEAAVATLECPELQSRGHGEAVVRLKYAYADALLALGERDKARDWFVKTALADVDDLTDAADRAVLISE